MAESSRSLDTFRERLTESLAEWGSEVSSLLTELERLENELDEHRSGVQLRDQDLEAAHAEIARQKELVETLRAESAEAGTLREGLSAKDKEIERLASELESKKELVRALRRDAERAEKLKSDARDKETEVGQLKYRCESLLHENEALKADNDALRAEAESNSEDVLAELEAARNELDARKSLIASLRADAERVDALEASLDEKRKIIATLENSMNRQSETITELQRKADAWKSKYESLKSDGPVSTSVELPALTTAAIEKRVASGEVSSAEQTIAIDMREPLRQARIRANESRGKG